LGNHLVGLLSRFYPRDHGKFTTIDYPGADITTPEAINNKGEVVGNWHKKGSGPGQFLFKYVDGKFTDFNIDGSHNEAVTGLTGMNNKFQAVGEWYTPESASPHAYGFIWTDGKFEAINHPGAFSTIPQGINDSDIVVGCWLKTGSGGEEGFYYVP
jgi:hypothetical protein